MAADRQEYSVGRQISWQMRETVATAFAWWDVTTGIPARPRPEEPPAS
ncbi:MAG: hypothetical protein U0531_01440 [Dehalococcoidia bacterium]